MVFEGNAGKTIEGMTRCLIALKEEDVERAWQCGKEQNRVIEADTEQGKILAVEQNGRYYPLNSCYQPDSAAKQWVKQFERDDMNANSVIMVFGLSDGRSILELCKSRPECKVIVYEPCQEIFWNAMCYDAVAEIAGMQNVCLIVKGVCEEYFFHALQSLLDYSNYQLVMQAVLPNYLQLFRAEYQEMLDAYKNVVELIIFTRNTMILRGVEIQHNAYGLAKDMTEGNAVVQLKNVVKEKEMQDIPAILVAAGPSLDKNIGDLKAAKNRAFLMVVDTALNTVLENGIVPDMTMSIDSRKPMTLFKNEKFREIPIALSMNSNKEVVKQNDAKHFYEIDENSYIKKILDRMEKESEQLPTGGSVANNALSLLHMMGFRTIILVGQDLAYPGGVEHTEAAYGKGKDKIDTVRKNYIEVEDNYGNKVLTEANMNIYRKWIENYIGAYEDFAVINATEGGAKIAGTKFMKLSDAMEQYCKREIDATCLLDMEPYFSEKEKEEFVQEMKRIPEQLEQLEELVRNGQKLYGKVDSLNGKSKTNSSQMRKAMEDITALNEELDALPVTAMLQAYMAKTNYEIQGEVLKYKENDSVMKQINDFVIQGKKMFDAYEAAMKQLREDMPMIMEDFLDRKSSFD